MYFNNTKQNVNELETTVYSLTVKNQFNARKTLVM